MGCICERKLRKNNNNDNNYNNITTTQNITPQGYITYPQPQPQQLFFQGNYIYTTDYPKKEYEYDYNYYNGYYLNNNPFQQIQNGLPINNNNGQYIFNNQNNVSFINDNSKLISEYSELAKRFQLIKKQNKFYFTDIKNQKEYISNYKTFIDELYHQLNNFHDQLNISVLGKKYEENLMNKKEKSQLLNDLDNISDKVKQLESIIENQNNQIKDTEINYKMIQEKFHEIKLNRNSPKNIQQKILLMNNDIILNQLNELGEISNNLQKNKSLYDSKKAEIENDIKRVQANIQQKVNQIQISRKNTFKNIDSKNNKKMDNLKNSSFLKGSMLLDIKDFGKDKDIFNSAYLFQEENDENYETQKLLKKNWNEICYINDNFDIYDINYELKAVGLPENTFFTSCSFGFILDTDIKVIEFEIDGKKTNYNLEKYSLIFNINLGNLESIKVHIKYQESPLLKKLTEGELKQRNISRTKFYGLSNIFVGQNAKFTLKNQSNFEIINFENEFFVKTNENEYTWGGRVPEGGKSTVVRLSRKQGKYKFIEKYSIQTLNNQPITKTTLKVPFCYQKGNNKLIKFNCSSEETKIIEKDENTKTFSAQFSNLQKNNCSLILTGEIINRCIGEWEVDLNDQEIEKMIPEDFKMNKQKFYQIANSIIKNYNSEHINDLVRIPDVAKIGKWIKNNIKYNINYSGRNDITATDTYNLREGVCDHFTKLFNALMYSLGYKVIYVLGYAIDKNDSFGKEDAHAWSLIKVDGKWLPFDAISHQL